MSCLGRGLLSICHSHTAVIVFVGKGGGLLGNVKVPQDTAYKEGHMTDVTSCHKLGLCRGQCYSWLKFCLVCDAATSKLNTNATERMTSLDATGPVGVAISHNGCCVVGWPGIQKQVCMIAVDGGEGNFGQVHMRFSMPEVDAIIMGDVGVADCVLEPMIMMFGQYRL